MAFLGEKIQHSERHGSHGLQAGLSSPGDSPMPSHHTGFCALVTPTLCGSYASMFTTSAYYHMSPFSASSSIGYSHHQCALLCREPWSWPGLAALRGMHHSFFLLESMAPSAPCAFQYLRDQGTPSGNEAFRCFSVCSLRSQGGIEA